jgi:hypothetical protein
MYGIYSTGQDEPDWEYHGPIISVWDAKDGNSVGCRLTSSASSCRAEVKACLKDFDPSCRPRRDLIFGAQPCPPKQSGRARLVHSQPFRKSIGERKAMIEEDDHDLLRNFTLPPCAEQSIRYYIGRF